KCDDLPFEITLEVRDTCLCLHLQRAARAVARRFDAVLRPLGLTSGQFSLLMSLNGPEAASIGDVASLLAMDRPTWTANRKLVEDSGRVSAERRGGSRAPAEAGLPWQGGESACAMGFPEPALLEVIAVDEIPRIGERRRWDAGAQQHGLGGR